MLEVNTSTQIDLGDVGKPIYFDVELHLKACEQLVRADEILLALELADKVPGYYRDNYPKELEDFKVKIAKGIYTSAEYGTDWEEAACERGFGESQWRTAYTFPRAEIIAELIKKLNDQGEIPWIHDNGASHGNLPLGLLKEGLKFNYLGRGINWRIINKVREWVWGNWADHPGEKQKTILFSSECLEHAWNMTDLFLDCKKPWTNYDYVLFSVPKYTLGGGLPEIERRLGHIRSFTPKEFQQIIFDNFRGYNWSFYDAPSMVMFGSK